MYSYCVLENWFCFLFYSVGMVLANVARVSFNFTFLTQKYLRRGGGT